MAHFSSEILVLGSSEKYTHDLNSLSPRAIQEIRIYPRVSRSIGTPVLFSPSNKLVEDFLKAFTDVRMYVGSSKGIQSFDHEWFLEIETTEGRLFQMACSLSKENIVYGKLGRFYEDGKGGGPSYGGFQSEELFQWYQQYSHDWLGGKRDSEEMRLETIE